MVFCSLFGNSSQRLNKCLLQTSSYKLNYSHFKGLTLKKAGGFKINQIRWHNAGPPPGLNRVEPEAIPFLRPELDKRGGHILLLIPAISFGLGVWQIYRLQWKTELIDKIKKRTMMDPVPLPLEPAEVAQMEFQKVEVTGTFDHDNELLYGPRVCLVDGKPNTHVISKTGEASHGFNLVTPMVVSGSGERILVNRGWMRTTTTKKEKRPWSMTEGEQTIVGVVRVSEPVSSIVPAVVNKFNLWRYRDIESMAESRKCLPIYIDATAEHSIPGKLWAGQTTTELRNEHLSYILTWFSLGIATSYMWYARYVKR